MRSSLDHHIVAVGCRSVAEPCQPVWRSSRFLGLSNLRAGVPVRSHPLRHHPMTADYLPPPADSNARRHSSHELATDRSAPDFRYWRHGPGQKASHRPIVRAPRRALMRRSFAICSSFAFTFTLIAAPGCAMEDPGETATIEIPLVQNAAGGGLYRLRDATFEITGSDMTVQTIDGDVDASSVSV